MRDLGLGGFGDPFAETGATPDLPPVQGRLAQVRESIDRTCIRAGRDPASVRVIGVTKTRSADEIRPALEAGLDDLAENYVQEARQKAAQLPGARWHMIGPLQRNKVNLAVDLFESVHSLHNLGLVQKLDRRCGERNRRLWGLLQIKLGGEKSKRGLLPEQALELLEELKLAPPQTLRLVGLMTVPPPPKDPEDSRPHFQALRRLLEEIQQRDYPFWCGAELSMGMSDDYLVAVEEGATMVRLGRVLFGERR